MQPFVKQPLSRAAGLQQLVQAKVSEGQPQHHHAEAQLMCAVLENPHRKCSLHIPGLHSGHTQTKPSRVQLQWYARTESLHYAVQSFSVMLDHQECSNNSFQSGEQAYWDENLWI